MILIEEKPANQIQSDKVGRILSKRGLKLLNTSHNNKLTSKNELIIDKAIQYASKKGLEKKILALLNQMYLYK